MEHLTRLIYVDDSAVAEHGWMVFGWVECDPAGWRIALREWLELRKRLYRDHKVPPSTELHATKFINGRDRISIAPASDNQGRIYWKDLGRDVAHDCLEALRDCEHINVGAIYRHTDARGSDFATEKYALYELLVKQWDRELAADGSFGFVTMDGNDRHYRDAHRHLKLDTRHLIEDPAFHDSKHSQWIQMADLVAYTALMHVNQHSGNEFGWSWYRDFLATSDPSGAPRQINS